MLVGDRHGDAGGQEQTWRTHPTLGRDRFHRPVRRHDTAIRVIEHAGVAKASLYNTFGGKEQLVRAYLGMRW
ncbi:TetR family transcriptional regulator [Streptomyces mirabilis]|uniref:TetR family transcriptional regulator n=1 Tax=Streptomyces mirabilis TaxID=68239 RepID=UPI00367DB254